MMFQPTNDTMDLMNWMITDEGAQDGPFWLGGLGSRYSRGFDNAGNDQA